MKAIEILNRCRAADAEISRIRQRIEQRNSALYRITASPMDANGGSRASGNHDKIGTLEADIDTLERQMLARKRAKQVEIAAACGYQAGTVRAKKAEALKLLAEMDSVQIDATLPGWYLRGDKDGSNGSNFDSADLPKWQERDAPPV